MASSDYLHKFFSSVSDFIKEKIVHPTSDNVKLSEIFHLLRIKFKPSKNLSESFDIIIDKNILCAAIDCMDDASSKIQDKLDILRLNAIADKIVEFCHKEKNLLHKKIVFSYEEKTVCVSLSTEPYQTNKRNTLLAALNKLIMRSGCFNQNQSGEMLQKITKGKLSFQILQEINKTSEPDFLSNNQSLSMQSYLTRKINSKKGKQLVNRNLDFINNNGTLGKERRGKVRTHGVFFSSGLILADIRFFGIKEWVAKSISCLSQESLASGWPKVAPSLCGNPKQKSTSEALPIFELQEASNETSHDNIKNEDTEDLSRTELSDLSSITVDGINSYKCFPVVRCVDWKKQCKSIVCDPFVITFALASVGAIVAIATMPLWVVSYPTIILVALSLALSFSVCTLIYGIYSCDLEKISVENFSLQINR